MSRAARSKVAETVKSFMVENKSAREGRFLGFSGLLE